MNPGLNIHTQGWSRKYSVMILLLAVTGGLHGQSSMQVPDNNGLQGMTQATALTEKLYVQTDRNFYLAGETIWFSLFDVSGAYKAPLGLSKVAYLEILDRDLRPVMQAKIDLKDGRGNGSLALPYSMVSGNYLLRAYTAWMKNFPPKEYFSKLLTIVNTTRPGQVKLPDTVDSSGIRFYAEGGTLVRGLQSKIVFRLLGRNGGPTSGSGLVIGPGGDTLLRFQTRTEGLGDFYFTPPDSGTCHTLVSTAEGTVFSAGLPPVADSGSVFQLKEAGNQELILSVRNSNPAQPRLRLGISPQPRSGISADGVAVDNGEDFHIDTRKLEEGLSEFRLSGPGGIKYAGRLYFNPPDKKLVIHGATDLAAYSPRQKVTVDLETEDLLGKPIGADCAVSVYRVDSLPSPASGDLYSWFWLYSELGTGWQQNFGFSGNYREDMDTLLEDLLISTKPPLPDNSGSDGLMYVPEFDGHIVTGRVKDIRTGKPAGGILTYLAVPGKRIQMEGCLSNDSGLVHFNLKDYYGPGEIVGETDYMADSNYSLEVFSPFSDRTTPTSLPALNLSPHLEQALADRSLDLQVENTYRGGLQGIPLIPDIDSTPFYGKPYKSYLLDDYTRFTTMEEDLREYVSELVVRKSKGRYHLPVLDESSFVVQDVSVSQKIFPGDPLAMVDGVPVFDLNKIISLDPLKVRKLDIIADRYIWGPITALGILSYTTYNGDLGGLQLDPRALIQDYNGLELPRKFSPPQYTTGVLSDSHQPDFRNLLFWSPSLSIPDSGQTKFSFYTSDLPGVYVIEIQGITADGHTGSLQFSFAVEGKDQ